MTPTLSIRCRIGIGALCILFALTGYAGEVSPSYFYDTVPAKQHALRDTAKKGSDTLVSVATSLFKAKKEDILNKLSGVRKSFQVDTVKHRFKLSKKSKLLPGREIIPIPDAKHPVKFSGGYLNYSLNYRSDLDTPYVQKNLVQHSITGNFNFSIVNLPVRLSILARKSNSVYFRDIYDLRADFNVNAFKDQIVSGLRERLSSQVNQMKDSLMEKAYLNKETELKELNNWLKNPLTLQRLIEMNEVVRIPSVSYDVTIPDSLARKRSDSVRSRAQAFLEMYSEKKAKYEETTRKVDSLRNEYYNSVKRLNRLKEGLRGNFRNWRELKQWKDEVAELSGNKISIPKKYEWLMGIRNFSLGKSPVSYSELTVKNISVNGINFEYNSWYYIAVTAGLVDYRFRDFSLRPFKNSPQYLYLLRLGIGDLQKNYFIVSGFRGQKQLYKNTTPDRGTTSFIVSGIAMEGKYQPFKSSSIIVEAAQSFSPDFHKNPAVNSKFWNLSDKTNKAFSVKFYSYLPQQGSRFEGMFKYTGANYQSFNSFQSGSALNSWYIKAEQTFFKRHLKIAGSIRSNEFSNPYIVQAYSSNTVFKSIQASFRKKDGLLLALGTSLFPS